MSFTEHNTVEQVILNATTSLGSGARIHYSPSGQTTPLRPYN
jgi:hypothetical protein